MATVSSGQIPQLIANAAAKYGVPPNLALEVAITESSLNQAAISPAGAIGVMQLMPATAQALGVDPTDTASNIDGGVRYLAQLLAQFGGDQAKALAAYNAGPGSVTNALNTSNGGDWLSLLPAETQNYVTNILNATGSSYQANVTPVSIATGAVQASAAGLPDLSSVPTSALLLLTAAAIGVFFFGDLLLDDDG